MRRVLYLGLVLIPTVLSGCVYGFPTPESPDEIRFQAVRSGLTRSEVLQAVGEPDLYSPSQNSFYYFPGGRQDRVFRITFEREIVSGCIRIDGPMLTEEDTPKKSADVPSDLDVNTLLDYLSSMATWGHHLEALERFAAREDAPKDIPKLLQILKEEAPRRDNNVCLVLGWILQRHPEAECPLDPLLEVIGRRIWTSQQKGSQALAEALNASNGKGREEDLYRSLIPLLTSQRSRVFIAALRCLQKFSGQHFGPDPEIWKTHYEKLFPGKTVDLASAIYERVVVIRPLGEKSPMAYTFDGEKVVDWAALRDKLAGAKAAAARENLRLGVVVQISDEAMDKFGPGHQGLIKEALRSISAASIDEYTISPQADVFRAPYSPPPKP